MAAPLRFTQPQNEHQETAQAHIPGNKSFGGRKLAADALNQMKAMVGESVPRFAQKNPIGFTTP